MLVIRNNRKGEIELKKLKVIFLMMISVIFLMTGCGSTENLSAVSGDKSGEQKENEESPDITENAKGRYLESDVELPEEISQIRAVEKLADGRIALFDGVYGMYISEDNGETFTLQDLPVMEELQREEAYIVNAAIGSDGSLVMERYREDGCLYIYIDADGNTSEFTVDGLDLCYQCLFLDDGRLLGCGTGVYVIDPQSESAYKLCDTKFAVEYMRQIGNLLYLVEGNGVEIFNLSTESFEEDTVLNDFVSNEVAKSAGSATEGAYPVLVYFGDAEDSLYIATSQGLFRHVLKGNVMEEVIKGSLSSMGSPTNALSAMISIDKETFLICYNSSVLKSYHYDPNVSAVPENELVVYSLEENEAVRTAINLYQKENPDTYLSYETGVSGEDGMTREDAIRNLNTALLSGEGPDILVLDGLPLESYMEKGILMDLSDEINAKCMDGEMYENIINSYGNEKVICAVPAFFSFPVCAGNEISGITDLESLADRVEKLREEYPEGNIIGSYREKEVLMRLYVISSPAFIKEDGSIDKEKLREYLIQAKRIWQAEKEGVDENKAQQRESMDEAYMRYMGRKDWYADTGMHTLEYASGKERLLFGELSGVDFRYSEITSMFKTINQEMDIAVLNGLAENVFVPNTILGINAAGEHKEAAKDFVMSMLDTELQNQPLGMGFPVNREAMEEELHKREGDEVNGMISWQDEDGNDSTLEISWPEADQLNKLEEMIESLDTPASADENVRDVVVELGVSALNGEMEIDEAVNEILNRIQIYLAE